MQMTNALALGEKRKPLTGQLNEKNRARKQG
jgi:hypothetical protein